MAAQSGDVIYSERSGISGTLTVGDIVDLATAYPRLISGYTSDGIFIYTPYQTSATDYLVIRRQIDPDETAEATGTLPLPVDLTTLTYS